MQKLSGQENMGWLCQSLHRMILKLILHVAIVIVFVQVWLAIPILTGCLMLQLFSRTSSVQCVQGCEYVLAV